MEVETGQKFKNPWHIRIIYDVLDNILTQEPDWVDETGVLRQGKIIFNREGKINRKVAIKCPRNHAKSTAASVNWPLKETYRDRNLRILLTSNTLGQATSFLREIKSHYERGDELIEVMGNLMPERPEMWNEDSIIINRDTKKKDPTFSATGAGGAVLSKRIDIGILDDLLNIENSKTPEARAKVSFWANNVFRPLVEPKTGRQIVIGTPWYRGDYLDERMKDPTYDVRLGLRAYVKDSLTGEGSEHEFALDIREVFSDEVIEYYGISAKASTLWPERWPLEELQAEEIGMGSTAFARQYLCLVISEDTQIIQSEWLEYSKLQGRGLKFLPAYNVSTSPYGPMRIASGWDLAVGRRRLTKQTSGYTVGITGGRNKNGDIYILKIIRGKYTPTGIKDQLKVNYNSFHPEVMLIENNAFQESMEIDMNEFTDLPIQGYRTGAEKWDEYIGVNSVGILFENHKIILPYSPTMSAADKKLIDQLVFECESFNVEGHTGDMLMALWFMIQGLRQLAISGDSGEVIQSEGFYSGRNRSTMDEDDED